MHGILVVTIENNEHFLNMNTIFAAVYKRV